jgi:hypothetical protein
MRVYYFRGSTGDHNQRKKKKKKKLKKKEEEDVGEREQIDFINILGKTERSAKQIRNAITENSE